MSQPNARSIEPSSRRPMAMLRSPQPADPLDAALLSLARILGAIATAKVAEERRRRHVA